MTSLAASVPSQPRRAAGAYVMVMAAAVLVWLAAAWQWHENWRASTALSTGFFLPLLLLVVAEFIHWRLLLRQRPEAFEIHDSAFVAPAADKLSAATAASMLAGAAVIAGVVVWPLTTEVPHVLLIVGRTSAALVLVAFLVGVTLFARGAGRVELRPEGLRIRYPLGSRYVPWEAVAAAPFVPPKLRIARPELLHPTGLARRSPATMPLTTGATWVRREFLVDAVNHYLAVPEARAGIGTAEGHEQLLRALRAG